MRNRTIGFVFQAFNLLRRTGAQKNVELPMIYAGVKARERANGPAPRWKMVGLGKRLGS